MTRSLGPYTTKTDGVTTVAAAHVNKIQTDVLATGVDLATVEAATALGSRAFGQQLYTQVSGAPAWRNAPWRDINDWGHLANGVDDSPAFIAALAATDYLMVSPKQGGGDWTIPFKEAGAGGGGAVVVPSGKTIKGLNKHAKIHCTGGASFANSSIFDVWGGVKDIIFEDLYFYGDNGTTPATFTYILNYQSNCIFQYTNASSQQPTDIVVRGCTFEYLWGFTVHNTGGLYTQRCHVFECTARYCANGFNMNAAYSIQAFNDLFHCEGFETTGTGNVTYGNVIREGLGNCMAQGGAGELQPGQIVANNYCHSDPTVGGEALSFGDGFVDSVVSGNTAIPSGNFYGLAFRNAFGATYQPQRNVITNNVIKMDGSSSIGLLAGSVKSTYSGNVVTGNSNLALQVDVADCAFSGNVFDVGTGTPRAFQLAATAQNVLIDASNQYAPFAWYDSSGGASTFRDGSFLRLTSRPVIGAYLRGATVAIKSTGAADDTLDKAMQIGGSGVYAWKALATDGAGAATPTFGETFHPPNGQSLASPGAGYLIFARVLDDRPLSITGLTISVGATGGNVNLSVWSSDGTTLTRLGTTGSVAVGAANAAMTISLGGSVAQPSAPTTLYYAVIGDSATPTLHVAFGITAALAVDKRSFYTATSVSVTTLPATILLSTVANYDQVFWMRGA